MITINIRQRNRYLNQTIRQNLYTASGFRYHAKQLFMIMPKAAVNSFLTFIAMKIFHLIDQTGMVKRTRIYRKSKNSILTDCKRKTVNSQFVPGTFHIIHGKNSYSYPAGRHDNMPGIIHSCRHTLHRARLQQANHAVFSDTI